MKLFQKSLQFLIHSRINTLHSGTINQSKCNSIYRSKERNFDTIYKCRNRHSHCLITGRFKALQAPYKTDKGTKNTETGKDIWCHFQNFFMYMKVYFIFVYIFFNSSDTFLILIHRIDKIIHSLIQISVIKNSFQA